MTTVEAIGNEIAKSPQQMAAGLRDVLSAASVVRENEPLARRTTLRVGGCADVWAEPADEKDLSAVLSFASEQSLPRHACLGGGPTCWCVTAVFAVW